MILSIPHPRKLHTSYLSYSQNISHQVLAYHGALDIICHYPGAEQLFSTATWPGHPQFMESHRSRKINLIIIVILDEKKVYMKVNVIKLMKLVIRKINMCRMLQSG